MILPYLPGEAELFGLAGRVRFVRRFGYPGRIDSHERVWLVVDALAGQARLAVNKTDLGTHSDSVEIDITPFLSPRNELTAEMIDFAPDKGLWNEAALEVRCSAYLRGVRVNRAHGEIHATGEVVGTAGEPLELYLVADRSPVDYARVDLACSVQPFALRAPAIHAEGQPVGRVKIELVQGAVVWYTVERDVPAPATLLPGP